MLVNEHIMAGLCQFLCVPSYKVWGLPYHQSQ